VFSPIFTLPALLFRYIFLNYLIICKYYLVYLFKIFVTFNPEYFELFDTNRLVEVCIYNLYYYDIENFCWELTKEVLYLQGHVKESLIE